MITNVVAQTFQDITPATLLPKRFANAAFGDLNNDGYPDLVHAGYYTLAIFKNNKGNFEKVGDFDQFGGESQLYHQNLDFGDLDRDGYLDMVHSGGPNNSVFYLIQNRNFSLTNLSHPLPNWHSVGFLGDWRNDGDLDVLASGPSAGNILVSDGQLNNTAELPAGPTRYAYWADFNGDSRLDIIQSLQSTFEFEGNFMLAADSSRIKTVSRLNIPHIVYAIDVADYDNDRDFDILVKDNNWRFRVYKYANGNFTDTGILFPLAHSGLWADINNDGLSDIILGGVEEFFQVFSTKIYLNQGDGRFVDQHVYGLPETEGGDVAVADIDNDGDLDLSVVSTQAAKVYKNLHVEQGGAANQAPRAPLNLRESVSFTSVSLLWDPATDRETQANALTYNLSLVKNDGTVVIPSHSLASGQRQMVKAGNAYQNTRFDLTCLQEGTYTWKVQAIDAGHTGSAFSQERSFVITRTAPAPPTGIAATTISDIRIDVRWNDQTNNETEYTIYRREMGSATPEFGQALYTLPKDATHFVDTFNLKNNTAYEYKVVAANCAYPAQYYATATAKTFLPAFQATDWLDLGEVNGRLTLLGDYDNDKDLDLLVSYSHEYPSDAKSTTKLFRFEGGRYVDSGIEFPYLDSYGAASWIDYDNDGYLDLFFCLSEPFSSTVKLFRNEGAAKFTDVNIGALLGLKTIWQQGAAWADYDNDGDSDLLTQGTTDLRSWVIKIYENKGAGKFEDSGIGNIQGILKSGEPWGDYDNDGDVDLIVNREVDCYTHRIAIYENNGDKTFTQAPIGTLAGLNRDLYNFTGDMKWGDYNNDGYADIVLSGQDACGNGSAITKIYRNNANKTFSDVDPKDLARLVNDVKLEWGDYDNDGDADIFMYGDPFTQPFSSRTKVYKNEGNDVFAKTNIDYLLESTQHGMFARGDIDQDGDLDLVVAGEVDYVSPRIWVYRNTYAENWGKSNQRPAPPANPKATVNGTRVKLEWAKATDRETASPGLSYNVVLYTDRDTIISSYASPDGTRKVAEMGNARQNNFKLLNLAAGNYQWAVQTIDQGFAGSAFSAIQSFTVTSDTSSRVSVRTLPAGRTTDSSAFLSSVMTVTGETATDIAFEYGKTAFDNSVPATPGRIADKTDTLKALVSGLESNTTYQARLKYKVAGTFFYSDPFIFATLQKQVPTAFEDPNPGTNGLLVRVYPNPSRQYVFVEHNLSQKGLTVALMNAQGKTLRTGNLSVIDISTYPPGMYYVRIMDWEKNVYVRKIIKH